MSLMLLGILNSQVTGGGGAAFDLLETIEISSPISYFTFTGLDTLAADYKHLQLRMVARNTQSGGAQWRSMYLRFNSDTSTSYKKHGLAGSGSSVYSYDTASTGYIEIDATVVDNDTTGGIYAPSVFDILDFSASNKNTTVRTMSGVAGIGNPTIRMQSGLYYKTNAITSISVDASYNFNSGSRFSLYGIKG